MKSKYIIIVLALLLQNCVTLKAELTQNDCSVLYRKGFVELLDFETALAELKQQFPKLVFQKKDHLIKWFSKSTNEVAVCKAIPDDNKCGSTYSFFKNENKIWFKGEDIITICSGYPR